MAFVGVDGGLGGGGGAGFAGADDDRAVGGLDDRIETHLGVAVGGVDGLIGLDGAVGEAAEGAPFEIDFVVGAGGEEAGAIGEGEAGGIEEEAAGGFLGFEGIQLGTAGPAAGLGVEEGEVGVGLVGDLEERGGEDGEGFGGAAGEGDADEPIAGEGEGGGWLGNRRENGEAEDWQTHAASICRASWPSWAGG